MPIETPYAVTLAPRESVLLRCERCAGELQLTNAPRCRDEYQALDCPPLVFLRACPFCRASISLNVVQPKESLCPK